MELMNEATLFEVYNQLKEKYSIKLTNTVDLNDGFSIDCPIIVAEAHNQLLYLYEYGGDFVLDVMSAEKTRGCHWHPFDAEAAVNDVITFIEGRTVYPLDNYSQE